MKRLKEQFAACGISLGAVSLGIFLALRWGTSLPAWLLSLALALFLGAALFCGYTGARPWLAPWFRCRPIQGAVCICLGIAVVWVPMQFVAATFLIGYGTRKVWQSACELESDESEPVEITIIVPATEIERNGEGTLATRERAKEVADELCRR